MDGMNNSDSWAQASTDYEYLKSDINLKDYRSWAQGSRCYE